MEFDKKKILIGGGVIAALVVAYLLYQKISSSAGASSADAAQASPPSVMFMPSGGGGANLPSASPGTGLITPNMDAGAPSITFPGTSSSNATSGESAMPIYPLSSDPTQASASVALSSINAGLTSDLASNARALLSQIAATLVPLDTQAFTGTLDTHGGATTLSYAITPTPAVQTPAPQPIAPPSFMWGGTNFGNSAGFRSAMLADYINQTGRGYDPTTQTLADSYVTQAIALNGHT